MEDLKWRKSTRSSNGGATCVELARTPRTIAVRDSKDTTGPHIELAPRSFTHLLTTIKQGTHDL